MACQPKLGAGVWSAVASFFATRYGGQPPHGTRAEAGDP
jgi:hypothetical protein